MNEICTDDYARNFKFVYTLKFKSHIKSYTFCTRTTGTVWQPRFRRGCHSAREKIGGGSFTYILRYSPLFEMRQKWPKCPILCQIEISLTYSVQIFCGVTFPANQKPVYLT